VVEDRDEHRVEYLNYAYNAPRTYEVAAHGEDGVVLWDVSERPWKVTSVCHIAHIFKRPRYVSRRLKIIVRPELVYIRTGSNKQPFMVRMEPHSI
jgi:hypothetical protein